MCDLIKFHVLWQKHTEVCYVFRDSLQQTYVENGRRDKLPTFYKVLNLIIDKSTFFLNKYNFFFLANSQGVKDVFIYIFVWL